MPIHKRGTILVDDDSVVLVVNGSGPLGLGKIDILNIRDRLCDTIRNPHLREPSSEEWEWVDRELADFATKGHRCRFNEGHLGAIVAITRDGTKLRANIAMGETTIYRIPFSSIDLAPLPTAL